MFKESYNPNLSIAQEGRNTAIEALRKGIQDTTLPLSVRLVRMKALVNLLKEKVAAEQSNVQAKIDLTEAEAFQAELLRDAANESSLEDKKQA